MDELFRFVMTKMGRSRPLPVLSIARAVVHTKHFYNPEDTFLTNVVGMRDSLHRAIEAGFLKYINCSTSEVYSMNSWMEGGVREDSPVLLATAEQSLRCSYATGKLLTEHFLKDCVNRGLIKGCSIRFANVYSPTEAHDEHIIPYIISSLMKTNSVVLLENAKKTIRTFLHNSDSCDAVIALLMNEKSLDGSIFNVGNLKRSRLLIWLRKSQS
jgi:dTDP-glucose 4,6-dehydratase